MRRIAATVLAAGASTRLGQPKQLLMYHGEPLVRHAANAALGAGAGPVIVVLGANATIISSQLHDLDEAVSVVTNECWREGLASSLAAGIQAAVALNETVDGILITVCDQPFVNAAELRRLLDAFDVGKRLVAAEYSGTIGVPAIAGREYLDALCSLRGDTGAGGWLRKHRSAVTCVPVPHAAVDIDTLTDAERHL